MLRVWSVEKPRDLKPAVTVAAVPAQPNSQASVPLRVDVSPMATKIKIGDKLKVAVKVKADLEVEIMPSDYGRVLGDWEVLAVDKGQTKIVAGEKQRVDVLTLTTYLPGEVEIPAVVIGFKSSAGQAGEYRSVPIKISVAGLPLPPGQKPGQIRDLKGSQGMIPLWVIILLVLVPILLGVGIWWFYFQKKLQQQRAEENVAPPRPPGEVARERLEALKKSDVFNTQGSKGYYIELSDILRRYLEGRFRIAAIDMTTYELMRNLKPKLNQRKELIILREFFERSDMAKFAKAIFKLTDAEDDWKLVSDFVIRMTITLSPEEKDNVGDSV